MSRNSRHIRGKGLPKSRAQADLVSGDAGNALPEAFVSSLGNVPGLSDPALLIESLDTEPPVSVRFNPYKLVEKPEGDAVPWSRYGFYLAGRPVFTLDPMFHGGAYYVQEPSSMFVEHIVRALFPDDAPLKILDLCAAPGGKTTLLSTLAGLESLVVANEPVRQRSLALSDNVKRWGLGNVVVTNNDPSHFDGFRDYFDLILVDAPCSGEGMFRKMPEARGQWSIDNVRLCAARQRRILAEIWDSLKPGGVLVYSTCTFNREENEDSIEWLSSEYGCVDAGIDADGSWGVVKGMTDSGIGTFRFFPHLVRGEGFFAAAVRKDDGKERTKIPSVRHGVFAELPGRERGAAGQWVNQPEYMHFASVGGNIFGYYESAYRDIKAVSEALSPVYSGVMMGKPVGAELRPEHALALFHDLDREIVPRIDIDYDEALKYLRKETFGGVLSEEGLNLLTYRGLPIGWAKKIGARCNNMYPKELRIMNV